MRNIFSQVNIFIKTKIAKSSNRPEVDGDSVSIARKSLIKRRRKKQRQRTNFYSTNYCEFLTPDNYTVDATENVTKKNISSSVVSTDVVEEKKIERQSTVSSSGFESSPSSERGRSSCYWNLKCIHLFLGSDHLSDLADDLQTVNIDSGDSTSTDEVNDDLDYLNLVFQEPSLRNCSYILSVISFLFLYFQITLYLKRRYLNISFSDQEPDSVDEARIDHQSEELTALSCEKVHSEILESVNRIRSSILTTRKNFLKTQTLSVDGSSVSDNNTASPPTKTKAKSSNNKGRKTDKVANSSIVDTSSQGGKVKKKKKTAKSNKTSSNSNSSANIVRKTETKIDTQNTPSFRTRTFYKKAGNITKLEVFLHQDVKKKKRKKETAKEWIT